MPKNNLKCVYFTLRAWSILLYFLHVCSDPKLNRSSHFSNAPEPSPSARAEQVSSVSNTLSGQLTFSDRKSFVPTASHHDTQIAAHEQSSAVVIEKEPQTPASKLADSSITSALNVQFPTSSPGRIFRKLDNLGQ
jgi:hypothetical protein